MLSLEARLHCSLHGKRIDLLKDPARMRKIVERFLDDETLGCGEG